jgi:hypothetical protein|nr:MAG TPA: hypothetical protein [Crassvirales sp.]
MNTINVNNEITAIINLANTAIHNAGTKDSAVTNYRLAYEAIVKLMSKARILQFVLCLIIKWAQPSQKKATLLRDILDNRVRKYGYLRKVASSLPSFYVLMGGAIAHLILRISKKESGALWLNSIFVTAPYHGKESLLRNGAIALDELRKSDDYSTRAEAKALRVVVSVCYYVGISDPLLCARLYLYRQASRIF